MEEVADPNSPCYRPTMFFDGILGLVITTTATLYALYADDLRILFATPSSDQYFCNASFAVIVLFTAEFVIFSAGKKKFVYSFFFWLDMVSICSLALDVDWLWTPLMAAFAFSDNLDSSKGYNVVRAGRASRIGTRAGRMMRFVRIVRLIRLVMSFSTLRSKKKSISAPLKDSTSVTDAEKVDFIRSNFGNNISKFIMQRVILGVLVMLVILTLLTPDQNDFSALSAAIMLDAYSTSSIPVSPTELQRLVSTLQLYYGDLLMFLSIGGVEYVKSYKLLTLRDSEMTSETYNSIIITTSTKYITD